MSSYLFVLFLVLLGGANSAVAQPTTFFGEDAGLDEDTRLMSTPNADVARADFLSYLKNVGTEDFESFADGVEVPLEVYFGAAGTATLQGTGKIAEVPTGTKGYGRYPISGDKYYWETSDVFYIEFSEPQVAFGFYGVDVGDKSGQLTIRQFQKNSAPESHCGIGDMRTNHFPKSGKRSNRSSNSAISFWVKLTPFWYVFSTNLTTG